MFHNIVVGVDGRQGGRDAIAVARRLAGTDATYTLAHVFGSALVGGKGTVPCLPYEYEDAARLLARERSTAGLTAETVTIPYVSPGRGLHEQAERSGADLIVVGSSRRALLGRVLSGDDTQAALNGAPCAVGVAPRGSADRPLEVGSIGVGYDGTQEAEQALVMARHLAAKTGAEIQVRWVISRLDVEDERPMPADWPAEADVLVTEYGRRVAELTGVSGECVYGGPREELMRLSEDVDLLVVGSRGYGPMDRLMHGTVASYLARHAAAPLLVMPRGVAAPGGDEGGALAGVGESFGEPATAARRGTD